MKTIIFRGAVYREVLAAYSGEAESTKPQGPQFIPAPPADPPGPPLTLKDIVKLNLLSKDEFEKEATKLADQMIHECQHGDQTAWCVAANGVNMGMYESRDLAQQVVKHWLFLKSKMPHRQVHMGAIPTRSVVNTARAKK